MFDGAAGGGVVKKGVVDSTTLSSGDVQTIERKLKDEVFLGLDELTVELSGEGDRGTATLKLKPGPRTASATITSRQGEPASLEVRGRLQVSMMALGMPKVSAPLNAFSVADAVEVQFEGFFLPSNG